MFAVLVGIMCLAGVPAVADDESGAWAYAMEPKPLRDRVRLLIDGESALEGHMRFFGNEREARLEGRFRDRDLLIRCTRNPLVDALNCWVRVDGELRSNHVVVQ